MRKPRAYYAVVPLAIPFLLASIKTDPAIRPAAAMMIPTPAPEVRYQDLAQTTSAATLPEHSVLLTIQGGDTLDAVLSAGGLSRSETAFVTNAFGQSVDLRRLRPGNLLRFHYDGAGKVDSVEMKVNGWGEVDAVRDGDRFQVTPRVAQQTEVTTTVSAKIDSSLYAALAATGENPQLAQQLVDVFQWDIDFFALQKGDEFSLVVKKRFAGSDATGYGPIEAARFVHEGKVFEAYRSDSDGRSGYYTAAGNPLRKQFLRAPLKFTRITSGFSKSRFHPILHCFRPHHGVDYGAPVGTPVMSTADGVVVASGYKGGEGNFVQIRHTTRIETNYLHLSRFAKGLKRGTKVTQGDVIGYVGMTGLATGPHLDYRVSDNGEWLDPLKLRSITPDPLHGDSLRRFRATVADLAPRMQSSREQVAQLTPVRRRALF